MAFVVVVVFVRMGTRGKQGVFDKLMAADGDGCRLR